MTPLKDDVCEKTEDAKSLRNYFQQNTRHDASSFLWAEPRAHLGLAYLENRIVSREIGTHLVGYQRFGGLDSRLGERDHSCLRPLLNEITISTRVES